MDQEPQPPSAAMPPPPVATPPPVVTQAPPPVVTQAPPVAGRPMGATVISIISGIEGVLLLLVGLVLVLGLGLFGAGAAGAGAPAFGAVLAGVGIVFGVIVLVVAALYLAIAYGVWTRKRWAWMLGMVLSIIALVFAVLGLGGGISASSLITLALPAIVLYFLWQPEVKRYLGRA